MDVDAEIHPLILRLSGPPQIERAGHPIQGIESDKALALLAYLALLGRAVSREHLAGLFWGELPQERGRGNLRRVLHNLAALLPGCLDIDRRSVRFVVDGPCRVDVAMFDALVDLADVAALAQAIFWYGGELLEGLTLPDCPEFELWLAVEQERWRQRVLDVLRTLAAHYTRQGEYRRALENVERALSLAPWFEDAHRQKMLLLVRTGQRGAALRQYQVCRRILAQELEAEPSTETTGLYRRILAAGDRPRHALPPALHMGSFVGRQAELAEIAHLLADPNCRLLTLTGPGGVGKTCLAFQAAVQNPYAFLDGTAWVPLTTVAAPSTLAVAVAQALDLPVRNAEPAERQLSSYLQDREVLIVLDNFDHLQAGTPLLIELLRQAPRTKLLVTSRERLNARSEWVFVVQGLPVQADREQMSDAATLFVQRARQADQRFTAAIDTRSVNEICTLLEGLPLGIDLAAALTPRLSCAKLAQAIRNDLDMLTSPYIDADPRHRSLHAVFEASWRLLAPTEQRALAALACFQGGFDRQAALHVTGASAGVLAVLVDKSLLRPSGSGRYDMHEMVRRIAQQRLPGTDQDPKCVQAMHGRYYAALLRRRETDLKGSKQREAAREVETEIDNVRAAWVWATEQRQEAEIEQMAAGLARFYELRGWFEEGLAAFERAAAALKTGGEDSRALGIVLTRCGIFQAYLGQHATSAVYLHQSLEALRTSGGTQAEIALAMTHFGLACQNTGQPEDGLRWCERSMAMAHADGDRWVLAFALNSLGNICYLQRQYERAARHYQEGAEVFATLGDQQGQAAALNNLGNVAYQQGTYAEAEHRYQQSLALKREVGDVWGVAISLHNLGGVAEERGALAEALPFLKESATLFRQTGYRLGVAAALNGLGNIARRKGDYHEAHSQYRAALDVLEGTDVAAQIAEAWDGLGQVAAALGKPKEARQCYIRALRSPAPYHWVLGTLLNLAQLMEAEGTAERALALATFIQSSADVPANLLAQAQAMVERLRHSIPALAQVPRPGPARALEQVVAELLSSE